MAPGQAFLQRDQQHPQLLALVVAKPGEQGVFCLALCPGGALQVLLAGWREGDEVTAAIVGVPFPGDQAVGLERVEHRDEDAGVRAHRPSELALARRAVIVEQAEHVELARSQAVSCVRVAQTPHREMAEQREQQPRTGETLFEHARSVARFGLSSGAGHGR